MNILFIAPLDEESGVHNWGAPSLGLIRIASYLKANLDDINITIFDEQVDEFDPIEKFKDERFDILGISVLHYTLVNTLAFIHKWRKLHPESLIVVGGNEASANYQDIFDKSPCDVAVLVEGEQVMVDLVRWKRGLIELDEIEGIIYRKYAKPISDDRLWDFWKDVDFSEWRYDEYNKRYAADYQEDAKCDDAKYATDTYVRLVTSSHCSRSCTFCSLALVRKVACGRNVKPASLKGWQIMELVNRIKRQLPDAKGIYFVTDDVFYPNKQFFYDFVDLYEQSGYDYRVLCQSSSYSLCEEDFRVLKRLGCQHLTIGIENASEKIRKSLHKAQDSEKIEQIVEWSNKYNIPVYFLIILFPPETTMEDLRINYDTINRWMDAGVRISIEPICYVYRGSPLYEDVRFEFLYEKKDIPGTNLHLKDSIYVLPKDAEVRELALEFKRREESFVSRKLEQEGHGHKFKGATGKILLELLGKLLKE